MACRPGSIPKVIGNVFEPGLDSEGMNSCKRFLFSSLLAISISGLAVYAGSPVDAINKNRQGVAIQGYDPVAYFMNNAAKGQPQYTAEYGGAKYFFSSQANRELFTKNPESYLPQFGGYCSWAVGHGYTADVDPEAWKIVDGKLYLNYNKSVQKKWEQDQSKWIIEAARNWPGLHK